MIIFNYITPDFDKIKSDLISEGFAPIKTFGKQWFGSEFGFRLNNSVIQCYDNGFLHYNFKKHITVFGDMIQIDTDAIKNEIIKNQERRKKYQSNKNVCEFRTTLLRAFIENELKELGNYDLLVTSKNRIAYKMPDIPIQVHFNFKSLKELTEVDFDNLECTAGCVARKIPFSKFVEECKLFLSERDKERGEMKLLQNKLCECEGKCQEARYALMIVESERANIQDSLTKELSKPRDNFYKRLRGE